MTALISIILLGSPHGKGRPRFRVIGSGKRQFVSTYTDPETRKYEDRLRSTGIAQMGFAPPFDFPLSVRVTALMGIPQSWSAKKQASAANGEIMPVGKPDGDNICKIALDALNGVVWRDDSLIVSLHVMKRYSTTPSLQIGVWRWFE